jgi:hypothetical protein
MFLVLYCRSIFANCDAASMFLLRIRKFSLAMEFSIVLPSEDLPDAPGDDSLRSSDFVSMQFSTPASITIRRPSRSPRVDLLEKKKRLDFPVSLSEGTSDPASCSASVPMCNADLDSKLVISEVDLPGLDLHGSDLHGSDLVVLSPAKLDLPGSRCVSPDLMEILDPGFVICPFDLGISADLRKNGPNVKPVVQCAELNGLADNAVHGPLDIIPDDAFDDFVPSIPDYELSNSDDGAASGDERCNLESREHASSEQAIRWDNASAADYEVVRKGGVRKSFRVEAWANKAFDEWRAFRGHSTTESIADLSEKPDVTPLVDLLVQYFLELKTQKLTLYSPGT